MSYGHFCDEGGRYTTGALNRPICFIPNNYLIDGLLLGVLSKYNLSEIAQLEKNHRLCNFNEYSEKKFVPS